MDPVVIYALSIISKKSRKKRRWAVHPINSVRFQKGLFYTLFEELQQDENKFFNYLRMSVESFRELSTMVRTAIKKNSHLLHGIAFVPEEMLAITLRFLATGCTYADLHYSYRVGISTAALIIKKMTIVIWIALKEHVFPDLDNENTWIEISNDFMIHCNYPHCLGSIDGKHVRILNPANSASLFYNYKKFFSIVLMAVADSKYKFIYVNVGSSGRESDPTIFSKTNFGKRLEEGSLNLPHSQPLSNDAMPLPYVFIGDEAFALSKHLMRPYSGKNLSVQSRIYNYRHSRARRTVECAFGILTNKWRIFHKAMTCDVNLARRIVKVCCALHNFVRDRDGTRFEDGFNYDITGILDNDVIEEPVRGRPNAYVYRDKFAQYFSSPEGFLPWQMNFI